MIINSGFWWFKNFLNWWRAWEQQFYQIEMQDTKPWELLAYVCLSLGLSSNWSSQWSHIYWSTSTTGMQKSTSNFPSRVSKYGGCFHSCWGWQCGDQKVVDNGCEWGVLPRTHQTETRSFVLSICSMFFGSTQVPRFITLMLNPSATYSLLLYLTCVSELERSHSQNGKFRSGVLTIILIYLNLNLNLT